MSNQEFTYTIKGITLNEKEVFEIYNQYQWFKDTKFINSILDLNNMELAQNVAEWYNEGGWSLQEDVTDAVQNYIYETLKDYLISNGILTKIEVVDSDDCYCLIEDTCRDKCNMNVETGENLCDELKPLHELYVKYNKWLKTQ